MEPSEACLITDVRNFKGCWLRCVFITTKYIILILLCKLLFLVKKTRLICGFYGYKNHNVLVLSVLKPWLIFISKHGNIVSLVVKLLPTLKHIINVYNQKKFHWTMKEAESDARISSFFWRRINYDNLHSAAIITPVSHILRLRCVFSPHPC